MEALYTQIAEAGARFGAEKILLFGSRARGDYKPRSDIDLAIFGMPETNRGKFWAALDELPTLLKFDILHVQPGLDPALYANILKDGVLLYEKG